MLDRGRGVILRRQLRDVDQAFRLEEDEFAILAPHTRRRGLVPMAERVAELIDELAGAPRGRGSRSPPGSSTARPTASRAERLLESATEATYAAKASGAPVARSPTSPPRSCKIRSAGSKNLVRARRTC